MGVRTGKGDKGYTELVFMDRVSKDSPEMRALGDIDEFMCYLGLIKVKIHSTKYKKIIETIQGIVGLIASEIAIENKRKHKFRDFLTKKESDWIQKTLFELEAKVIIESRFQLPGNNAISAHIDIARAIARRAERSVVALLNEDNIKNNNMLLFLNCVSDILFVMARKYSQTVKKSNLEKD